MLALPGRLAVYAVVAAPALWLLWRLLARRQRMPVLYAMLLYTTFLGSLVRLPSGVSLPITLAAGIVFLELLLLGSRARRIRIGINRLDVLVLALAVWAVLATTLNNAGPSMARESIILALVVFATKFRPDLRPKDFRLFTIALLMGGVVVALVCITQSVRGSPSLFGMLDLAEKYRLERVTRPTGLQGNPNAASLYLLFGVCAGLMLITSHMTKRSLAAIGTALVLIGVALYYCESRSAIIGAIFVAGTRLGWMVGFRRAAPFLIAAGAASLVLLVPEQVSSVGQQMFESRGGFDETGRSERWQLAWEVISNNPILGDPNATFHHRAVNYHNDILQLAGSFGIPAALFFVAILSILGRFFWRASGLETGDGHARLLLLVLLGGFIHGMFHVQLLGGICFWMLMGLGFNAVVLNQVAYQPHQGATSKPPQPVKPGPRLRPA